MEEINQYMPLSHDWNSERLETLKTMFPDLFTSEGKLNADELKKLIDPQSINETERYEFRWFGKSQAKRNAFTPSNTTLVYDEKRSINPDKAENLIIEGENLEVLKLLSAAYREKVKCIYIDPPYNTGKDFVYSDNFSQDKKSYWEEAGITEDGLKVDTNTEADGRYHSNWLNMMYSRLLVARALLKPDGVIFISIDDNEVHNLRKLCDEVFGEENFRNCIIVRRGVKSVQAQFETIDRLNYGAEYIIVYSKNPDTRFEHLNVELEEEKVGTWNNHWRGTDRPTMRYEIFGIKPESGQWRWGKDRSLAAIDNYKNMLVEIGTEQPTQEQIDAWYTQKLADNDNEEIDLLRLSNNNKPEHYIPPSSSKLVSSLWADIKPNGNNQLKNIFKKKVFETPKSIDLLKRIFTFAFGKEKDGIILDFFGGSGATGQAVVELNEEDNGNRKFLLVQIPELTHEKTDAYKAGYFKISDITIDRNKILINRFLGEKNKQSLDIFKNGESDKGLGFKVFKLTKSKFPRVEWTPEADKTEAENIEALKKYIADKEAQLVTMFNREELTTEILLKKGFNLNYNTEKQEQFKDNNVYLATDGNKQTLICLDAIMHDKTVEYLKTNNDKQFICLERALDTTKKWNLKNYLNNNLHAF